MGKRLKQAFYKAHGNKHAKKIQIKTAMRDGCTPTRRMKLKAGNTSVGRGEEQPKMSQPPEVMGSVRC
jgi:hypothetical protein